MFGLLNSYMSKIKPTRNFTISGHERNMLHFELFQTHKIGCIVVKYFSFIFKITLILES